MNDHIINKLKKIGKKKTSKGEVANFLISCDNLEDLTIQDISDKCFVSVATPTRVAQEVGLRGFKELKYEILANKKYQVKNKLDGDKYKKEVIDVLKNTLDNIDADKIKLISKQIQEAKRINIFSVGLTHLLAQDFSYRIERLGKWINCYTDVHQQYINAQTSNEDTLAIGISYSGITPEILDSLKTSKELNAKTILITNSMENLDYIDTHLYLNNEESIYNEYSLAAKFTMIAVLEVIYIKFVELDTKGNAKKLDETRIIK